MAFITALVTLGTIRLAFFVNHVDKATFATLLTITGGVSKHCIISVFFFFFFFFFLLFPLWIRLCTSHGVELYQGEGYR